MSSDNIKILIIDDEPMLCSLIQDFLEDFDFEIETVNNGNDAIKIIETQPFDAAIVDLNLPDFKGIDLIKEISKIRTEMKFLIHTGDSDFKIPEKLISLGIKQDSIIFKPTKMQDIYEKLKNIV